MITWMQILMIIMSPLNRIKKKRRYRKRVSSEEDEDYDEEMEEERQVKRRTWADECQDSSDSEEERLRDQREREELERNIRERESDAAAATRKLTKERLKQREAEEAFFRTNADVEALRKVSRQVYLKKREQKKLEEIIDDLEDMNYLFEGVKLTEAEDNELSYRKQILELVKKQSDDQILMRLSSLWLCNATRSSVLVTKRTRFRNRNLGRISKLEGQH